MTAPYLTALVIGLFSTMHCLGMCGGIMGALTLSLEEPIRNHRPTLFAYVVAYNAGRLASYAAGGAIVGMVGAGLYQVLPQEGHLFLRSLAATLLVGVGLYLAGWFPRFAAVERLGVPVWRALEPIGRRLLPVRHPAQALVYGSIWGWLPCGLVYSALLLTVTSGGPLQGSLFMTAFGVGTLPGVLGAGILTGRLQQLARAQRMRQLAGSLLIVLATAGFLLAPQLHKLSPFYDKEQPLQCR